MLTGCLRTSLSNFLSLNNFKMKMHIVRNKKGSVGKLMLIGVLGINTDNSTESGVQNRMRINNLSSARNASKHIISTNGIRVMMYDSFHKPTALAIINRIAAT